MYRVIQLGFFGRFTRAACVAALMLALVSSASAQRNLKDIPPPDPELERKTLEMAEGFEVNLFAADPRIAKPIQMNFDPAGRLWVVGSSVYPHIKPGEIANDKVLVLEDTNGDGKANKTTVFADGLLIPTGVAPGDGGVYVANSTEVLFFKDTNGDGKADSKRIVLSGFGTEDTHHILHTLRWAPDGRLYMNQSIYIHSHIETPFGVRRLNGGGIWWFRPETGRMEVFARGWVNSWGHHVDAYGQSFVTDGAGGQGINYAVPGAAYQTAVGVPRLLPGLNPGSPKYCGLEIVGGRHLPDDWQGNLLTNDFRGHRVCRFVLKEDGSGFASQQLADLIKSKHVGFRPIDIKMGPDGAIYIADWYNPIIQHGEVDFRDPRRDHVHGRIWRVTYKGRKLVKRPQLVKASVTALLDQLKSPEMQTREQTCRVLQERDGEKVSAALKTWVAQLDDATEEDPLVERHRLEALWVSQAIRHPNGPLLERCLLAKDHRVRAAAVRVLKGWVVEGAWETKAGLRRPLADAARLLREKIGDEHPRVRLEAVRALAEVGDVRSIPVAMRALDQPVDRFLEYALWLTAWESRDRWVPELQAGRLPFGSNSQMAFALKAAGSPAVVPALVKLIRSGDISPKELAELLPLIITLGGPNEAKLVLEIALDSKSTSDRTATLLTALAKGTSRQGTKPAGDLSGIASLFKSDDEILRSAAIRCAGLWKIESLRKSVMEIAIEAVASFGGDAAKTTLGRIASKSDVASRTAAVLALTSLDATLAADAATKLLADETATKTSEFDAAGLYAAFLLRKQGATILAKPLGKATIPSDVAKIGLRAIEASGREQPALEEALRKAGRITSGPKTLSPAELAKLVAEVKSQGDPSRGEAVFRRKDLVCAKCHAIGGAGGRVRPDLISLGASAQVDYLIESLLEPNKKVKENYNTIVLATDAGKVHSGILLRRTDTEVVLRDAEDREIAIAKNSIEEEVAGASIMPAGLTEKLTRRELVDLVRFLSELGKVGKFAISRERVVRRWRVMNDSADARFRLRRTSYQSASGDDPAYVWSPAYSKVEGGLPLSDIPELRVRNRVAAGTRGVGFVRCELDVTTPGKIALRLGDASALKLWLDGRPVETAEQTVLDLSRGLHRLTFSVDLASRKQPLRVAIETVPDSEARVQVVGGK